MSLHVFKKGIFGILIDVREVSLHEDIQFKMPWKKLIKQEKSITKEESKQEGSKEGRAQEESLTKEESIIEEVSFKEESVKEQEMRDRKGEYPIMDIDFKFDFTLCRFDVSVNLFTLWGDSTVDLKNL